MEPERVYLLYGAKGDELFFVPIEEFSRRFVIVGTKAHFKVNYNHRHHDRIHTYLYFHMLDEARSDIKSWEECSLHVQRILSLNDNRDLVEIPEWLKTAEKEFDETGPYSGLDELYDS